MRGYKPTKPRIQLKLLALIGTITCGPFLALEASAQGTAILEEITVTATRREQNLQDVPISVATMSGEKLNALFQGSEDILALSGRVPGLYAESSNGRAAPRFYLRGLGNIDFDLGASQPVSLIMDDVVMENVVLKSFPLFDLNNVEVIRGPQGTLFGRNTPAGIVKINTRRPEQETSGYVRASVGTNTTANLEGAFGGPIADDWSLRVSGLLRNRDNWIDNAHTGEQDSLGEYSDYAGRAQLMWEPSEMFKGLLSFQARRLEGTSSIFRANVFTKGSNELNQNYDRETVYYDGGDKNPQKYDSMGTTLNLEWEFATTTLTSISSYQSADGSSRGDIDGGVVNIGTTPTPPPGITFADTNVLCPFPCLPARTWPGEILTPSVTEDGADTSQLTQEFRLANDASNKLRWQTGVFYFDSSLDVETESFASMGFGPVPQNTKVEYNNTAWAVFGQLEYDFSDRFTGVAGLRYTDDQKDYKVNQYGALWLDLGMTPAPDISVSDDNVSWDLAINYALTDKSSLFARVAQGFRAQTIQGRDVAFLEYPSTAKPETITSYEIGYKADLANDRVRINTAVFYYEVDDMQLSVIGGASNVNQVINADKGAARGIEFDGEFLITDNLIVTAGLAAIDSEIKDPNLYTSPCGSGLCTPTDPVNPANAAQVSLNGNPFPRVPDYNASFTLSYSLPVGSNAEMFFFTDWMVNGLVNMPLYESLEFTTKGQYEGGLRIGYRNYNGWEVALFGRNITDEDNTLGFVDFSNNTGFVNEPRVWGVEAGYNFGGL
jgi:iron complex outermembrane receptor protein